MSVGARLRQIRRQRGLSLTTVAARVGLSHPALSKMERGLARIDADLLPRLAQALGVEPCTFFAEHPAEREAERARDVGREIHRRVLLSREWDLNTDEAEIAARLLELLERRRRANAARGRERSNG